MHGEFILTETLSQNRRPDSQGNLWQYNSRSDYHSKVACWGIMFDLLLECPKLRNDIEDGRVGFGINHEMTDYRSGKKKDLDLVLCTPGGSFGVIDFVSLARRWNIALDHHRRELLEQLPLLRACPVATALLAVEAKACMTEHSKAIPRLNDELTSSFRAIAGDTNSTIAAGYVVINVATEFLSSVRNGFPNSHRHPLVTKHRQPFAAEKTYTAVNNLARRSAPSESGFDAVGVTFLNCRNDGTSITMENGANFESRPDELLTYDRFIGRLAALYASRFPVL